MKLWIVAAVLLGVHQFENNLSEQQYFFNEIHSTLGILSQGSERDSKDAVTQSHS